MARRDLLELARGALRFLELSGGEHDLHERGQQPCASCGLARLSHGSPDRGRCSLDVALREPQQGETGLGLPAETARLAVGGFGGSGVTEQAMHLCLPVPGLRCRGLVRLDARREPCPGLLGFGEGVVPPAVMLHHLGAVDEALTRVDDEIGLFVAPSRESGRPFVGAAQLVHLVAAGDEAAVDDPRDEG